jgi:RNA polymerase sigma factor (sigma-70 family)
MEFSNEHYERHLGHMHKSIRETGILEFVEYDDAVQECNILYLEAIDEFDITRSQNFSQYIKQKIEWKFNTIIKQRIRDGKTIQMRHTLSLDKVSKGEYGVVTIGEFVADEARSVEQEMITDYQRDSLNQYMLESDYKELYESVLKGLNLEEIGAMFGYSRATAHRKRKKMIQHSEEFIKMMGW